MGKLFGTDGVRGVVNKELTGELAYKLGLAIGTFFGEGSALLVGRDARLGGEMVYRAVTAGLLASGVKPYYAGLLPTPALQYGVKALGFDGGVMITASHNPPEYCGIKVLTASGIEISREQESEIEEIFYSQKWHYTPWWNIAEHVGRVENVTETYIEAVLSHVDVEEIKRRRFRVLIDCGNGVGAYTSPEIARRLGCKVYSFNGHVDGHFPGRHPEPTVESLKETAEVVKALNVDLAVAHDGDADRAIIIDDKGRVHWGDRSATLLCKYLVEKGETGTTVVTAVSSSVLVEEYLKPLGVEVLWTKVGSVIISYKMLELGDKVLSGFEENGGFMYPPHQLVRDGGMKLALLLDMLAHEKKSLSELFDELPKYYPIKKKIPMSREEALKAVERVKEYFKNYRLVTIDGVKVFLENGWVLVRPSGTEPVLRVMVEGKSKDDAKMILEKVEHVISQEG